MSLDLADLERRLRVLEDIEAIKISESSFMPTGLLKDLNDRERIELFKYLMGL